MLVSAAIRDIVLIERLELALAPGLCVITGETGAGKSILLDALQLVTGARSERALLRTGAAQGAVSAAFEPPDAHPVRQVLAAEGFPAEGEIILRRTIGADGRTRAFLNDAPVSVALLKQIGGLLVEVHGQHDERGLLAPAGHRALLDAFGGLGPAAEAVAAAHAAHEAARATAAAAAARQQAAEAEADDARAALAALQALAPRPGEEAELAAARARLMAGERIAGDLALAAAALQGAGGLEAKLNQALRRLERAQAGAEGRLDAAVAALSRALVETGEAGAEVAAAERALAFDAAELQRIDDRLAALREAGRRFRMPPDLLPGHAEALALTLAALATGDAELRARADAAAQAGARLHAAARVLSEGRAEAAGRLAEAVQRELKPLKLDKARFRVALSPLAGPPGPEGAERVAFEVQTNPGTPFGPLQRIASGGELARFVLALKVALAGVRAAPTLIFDEIDQGVGGAVADAIGERLALLGRRAQVLVVTHSPQIAARADHHWLITKAAPRGRAVATRIAALDAAGRADEIARMLSGAEVTPEARRAAERLIALGAR